QSSTGPRTPDGKARASRNARRHGRREVGPGPRARASREVVQETGRHLCKVLSPKTRTRITYILAEIIACLEPGPAPCPPQRAVLHSGEEGGRRRRPPRAPKPSALAGRQAQSAGGAE